MSTWYRQGTISVTNGIATVTGIGTAWGAANTHPGDVLLAPDGKLYEILSVDSVTQLTIKPTFSNQIGYQGTTDTSGNAKYAIAPLVGSTTTADLAQRISAILTAWQDRQDELSDWQGGTVTGGDGNGYYPLTDSLGAVTHVMCPAKITSIVGNLDAELTAAQGYATAAQSSATSAQTYASQAVTSATNAGNSASAASTSATNASNSASSASTSAGIATTKASEASSSASSASSSASSASTSATNANNSAIAAAASAASINPSSIAITGGTINNTTIGATTPSTGAFTTLSVAPTVANTGITLAQQTGTRILGIAVHNDNYARIFTDGTSPLVINQFGGNLLVGTTTDDGINKLQVNGGGYFSGNLGVTGNFVSNKASVFTATGNGQYSNIVLAGDAIYKGVDDTVNIVVAKNNGSAIRLDTTQIKFRVNNDASDTMTLSSTGLSVNGGISATSFNDGVITNANARNRFHQLNLGTATPTVGWIAAAFGDSTADNVVVGQFYGKAVLGVHTPGLDGWSDLYINPVTQNTSVIIGANTKNGSGALLQVNGGISASLPTADPHVAGTFWRSGNTVMVSTG